jgi:predicted nucleotidyltransferase
MNHLQRARRFIEAADRSQSAYPRAFYRKIADLVSLSEEVVAYLQETYGIKPVLIGGIAIQQWGYERQTTDLDILVSQRDYRRLMQHGEIEHGHLDFPGAFPIDVLCEGVDRKPGPEVVRDGASVYPTFEGLILLKLIANRLKDRADIVELLKRRPMTAILKQKIVAYLPEHLVEPFILLWLEAAKEKKQARRHPS